MPVNQEATVVHQAELTQADIEKVFSTIDIPACPAIVNQVLVESQCDQPNLNRLARAIVADPAMVAGILKLANSPLFRSGAAITDVRHALDRLGMRNVVCVVIAAALRASMTGVPPAFIEKFWNATATLASLAGMIARRLQGVPADLAYTYALFHDVGIPLMVRRFPDYHAIFEKHGHDGCALVEAEEGFFPCTHPVIGSLLVRNWGLPPVLHQAIRVHHYADLYEVADTTLAGGASSLVAVTQIAERLLHEARGEHRFDEAGDALFGRAVAHFALHEADLDDLRELAHHTIDRR
jgi:putative nucleotidyltransferase with HDIG domain